MPRVLHGRKWFTCSFDSITRTKWCALFSLSDTIKYRETSVALWFVSGLLTPTVGKYIHVGCYTLFGGTEISHNSVTSDWRRGVITVNENDVVWDYFNGINIIISQVHESSIISLYSTAIRSSLFDESLIKHWISKFIYVSVLSEQRIILRQKHAPS